MDCQLTRTSSSSSINYNYSLKCVMKLFRFFEWTKKYRTKRSIDQSLVRIFSNICRLCTSFHGHILHGLLIYAIALSEMKKTSIKISNATHTHKYAIKRRHFHHYNRTNSTVAATVV